MKPSTILKRAKKIILSPKRWTKGADAKDRHGFEVSARDKTARCFCAGGACERAAPAELEIWDDKFNDVLGHLRATNNGRFDVSIYNDNKRRTHKQVLNWFDRAIKRALKVEARS